MAFAQKIIVCTINGAPLGPGLRTSVHIETVGNDSSAMANVRIWGMTLSDMNRYSTIGLVGTKQPTDQLTISAGDAATGTSQLFSGTIYTAMPDFQGPANVPFHIIAQGGLQHQMQNIQATSINGQAQVSQIISQLAGQMGLQFEDSGVQSMLSNPYFSGSAREQVMKCMHCVRNTAGWIIENGKLAIWPHTTGRTAAPQGNVISPQTGMVGYPSAASVGIKVKVLYKPPGYPFASLVTVTGSAITKANDTWMINKVSYDLESFKPHGQWFVTLELWKGPGGQGGSSQGQGAPGL